MPLDFRPPKENRLLLRLACAALPAAMRRVRGIAAVTIRDDDWSRLEGLRGHRAILSANHPTTDDPLIALFLSRAAWASRSTTWRAASCSMDRTAG